MDEYERKIKDIYSLALPGSRASFTVFPIPGLRLLKFPSLDSCRVQLLSTCWQKSAVCLHSISHGK